MSRTNETDRELIARAAKVLDDLGPFTPDAPREAKWRTTEQLADALRQQEVDAQLTLDRLDEALRSHEACAQARLNEGLAPEALIRRAVRPDRTTALPLWGSTNRHGQPWLGQAQPQRLDDSEEIPYGLLVPDYAPKVFISHTKRDAKLAMGLAHALADMGMGAWMFETHIERGADIAACVRSALAAASACVALVTRDSIASLWVLTELHTAIEQAKRVTLVVNTYDGTLLDLLNSVRLTNPQEPFDHAVSYDPDIVERLRSDFSHHHPASQVERYADQVRDFLRTLPLYLRGRPALAYPDVPSDWTGPFLLASLRDLCARIEREPTQGSSTLSGTSSSSVD